MHVIVCVWSAVMKKQQNEKRNKQKNAGKKYVDIKQTNILTPCSLARRTRKPVWLHSGSVLVVCCACVRVDEEAGEPYRTKKNQSERKQQLTRFEC